MSIFDISIFDMHPKADDKYVVKGEKYRFTILTSRMLRMEYSESGVFEDRATRLAFNRAFDTPDYEVYHEDGLLHIVTDYLHLTYDEEPFSASGLQVTVKPTERYQAQYWFYGREMPRNLGGTVRTLDGVNGAIPLPDGLVARTFAFKVLDDTKTIAIGEDGWMEPTVTDGRCDLYFFGYHQKPEECIRDFYKLSGPVPLLPRYALGNWWSRYFRYSEESYLKLMDTFIEKDIPLAVSVVDMDWHIVKDKDGIRKWTGWTWNEELFPDYKRFLKALHDRGLHTALNLHPRDGIAADEVQYAEMCETLGHKQNGKPVEFDASNRDFLYAYFEKVLHPYEDDGVDFWWLDWQQAGGSKKAGYDPLFMLNHCHYTDNARGGKRPLAFSRYAEPGSHRYPVGFSGDTVISWESLQFQPYFTATASNIGFSMWSHDIGGFKSGIRDDELYTRWVQLGVFSPIFRLHSAPNSYISKEPWSWGETAERVVSNFMRLRHRLIPYLYTMNVRNHEEGIPMIRPLYHTNVNDDGAYNSKNVYWFGSELIAAPITEQKDETSRLAKAKVWLPSGIWIDFFNGHIYRGGRNFTAYRTIDEMPVFAKAGAIVPLAASHCGTDNPDTIELCVFGGADGAFTLVEDNDGIKDALVSARTEYTFTYGENAVLKIASPICDCVPKKRTYTARFVAFSEPTELTVCGKPLSFTYDARTRTVTTDSFVVLAGEIAEITVVTDGVLPQNEARENALAILRRTRTMPAMTLDALHRAVCKDAPASARVSEIHDIAANEYLKGALIELITEF